MKTPGTLIGLAAALILPSAVLAFGGNGDPIAASFEHDLNREPTVSVRADVAREQDPLEVAFRKALDGYTDPILASFQRDLNREPTPRGPITMAQRVSDPLVMYIAAALSDPQAKPTKVA